jgi:DNA-binding LytR/AlgR family response regulator
MNKNASDTLMLAIVMYLIVFLTSVIIITKQLIEKQKEIYLLKENMNKLKHPFLHIISQRKSVRISYDEIQYIESYSDSIKFNLANNKEITSKERLSSIEKKLPDTFLRIHRSFIVNLKKVTRFDYDEVEVKETTLKIGRTYKNKALQILKGESKVLKI